MKLRKLSKLTALLFAASLTLAACGTPTVEGADSRYKSNKDRISVLITKQPTNKAEFEKKLAEFETEYQEAMKAGTDEEKIKKLGALNSRMDKYLAEFEKADDKKGADKKGGAEAPSKKLDGAGTPPAGTPPAGTAPAGTAPADGSGGMGGSAPAGGKLGGDGGGGSAPAGQPSGGMGGSAPAGQPAGGMGGM